MTDAKKSRTQPTARATVSGTDAPARNPIGDIALLAWFVLCIAAFWGPYIGLPLPPAVATALYALFLVGGIVAGLLRFLRSRPDAVKGTGGAGV